jgi:hypothetical protein
MGLGFFVGFWGICGSFNIKPFLATCIFSVVDQPKGLVVCDNGSAHCKIAKDVSQLKATSIS